MSKKSEFTYKRSVISPSYLAEVKDYFEPLEYLSPVLYKNSSRYKNLRTIKNDIDGKLHHESPIQQAIPFSDGEDKYVTITNETENRLDILAYQYYGSAKYWWVIALANYIIDPFDIPVGSLLRIPPMLSLYKSGGVLNG